MVTQEQAEELALEFLLDDLAIVEEDKDWFAVRESRSISENWYVVELEVSGYPDKWVIQVYDTAECDPCYTFVSPVSASEATSDLEDLPEAIADILAQERRQNSLNPIKTEA